MAQDIREEIVWAPSVVFELYRYAKKRRKHFNSDDDSYGCYKSPNQRSGENGIQKAQSKETQAQREGTHHQRKQRRNCNGVGIRRAFEVVLDGRSSQY